MNQLSTIIAHEYRMDLRGKGFWIATFILPLVAIGFGIFIGYISEDSSVMTTVANPTAPDADNISGVQILAMMMGIFMAMFLMIYGAQIFAKVKTEKCNRIAEIIVACVPGRTMMLAKVISVGLLGLTQLLLWSILIAAVVLFFYFVLPVGMPLEKLFDIRVFMGLVYSILYFVGGYLFFGSLYAATGALTDQNNENQEFMTIITFVLLGSFYIGMYAVDHAGSMLSLWCGYIPFTSPTIGAIRAISGNAAWWETLISILLLYASAWFAISIAGKIYTSALLLRGKKLSFADLIIFLRTK